MLNKSLALFRYVYYFKSQYPESDLNKIAKTFNKTYVVGLKSMLQRFKIYFFQNPSSKGVESTS